MKTNVVYLIILFLGILLLVSRFFLGFAGIIADGEVLSFDVDSKDNIYIGTMRRINVYNGGALVRQITPPTSRVYRFYIEDDKLIIGCVSDRKGGVFDLYGKKLSYGELSYYEIESVAKQKSVVVNGHEYKISNALGILPYKILRDGEEVHRMSTIDYIFNGLPFWLACICLFLAIVVITIIKVSAYQTAILNGTDVWKAIFG